MPALSRQLCNDWICFEAQVLAQGPPHTTSLAMQVDGPGAVGPSGQPSLTAPAMGFPMDAARELHSFEIDPKRVRHQA